MDSRFCSLTACLKNAKNTKGQSAICEGLEKYKKNTKIQIAFLDVMEKYKKNTKIQSVFLWYSICMVFGKNTKKIQKQYECNCSKIQNTKKNTNAIALKYKIQKRYERKLFKNTKYQKKKNQK